MADSLSNNIMKTLSPLKITILATLMLVALVGVFSVPNDDLALGDWFMILIGFKAVGFGAGYIALKMMGAFEK